jgi:hypothetical protein
MSSVVVHYPICCILSSVNHYAHCHLCRECQLDPDSLQPVAQLLHLKELHLISCPGLNATTFESFLRTAVQGQSLRVYVFGYHSLEPGIREQMRAVHNSLVESMNAQNIPYMV